MVENIGSKALDVGGDVLDKAGNLAEDIGKKVLDSPIVDKAGNLAEDIGNTVLDKGGKAFDKAKDVAGDVGSHVLDTYKKAGNDLKDKAKDFFDEAQEAAAKEGRSTGTAEEEAGNLMDKAKNFFADAQEAAAKEAGNITGKGSDLAAAANQKIASDDSISDMVEKAKKLADDAQAKVDGTKPFVPNYQNKDSPLLDGQDDFFEKASRFADGDYHMEGKKPSTPELTEDPTFTAEIKEGSTKGFEDMDGDGSDIVDDAIVISGSDDMKLLELPDDEEEEGKEEEETA